MQYTNAKDHPEIDFKIIVHTNKPSRRIILCAHRIIPLIVNTITLNLVLFSYLICQSPIT
jgi:hypothetical protein